MNSITPPSVLSRRSALGVLALAGGGVAFGVPLTGVAQTAPKPDFGPGGPTEAFQYWLTVDADSTLTVGVHMSEMGQGISTSLPQLVAEELSVPWEKVRFVFTPNGAPYYNRGYGAIGRMEGTGGSNSIRAHFTMFREIGATAREMFKAAAAAKLNVKPVDLVVENGAVTHPASGRTLTLGELAASAARQTPPATVALKPRSEWRVIGQSVPRLDTPAKVDGSARFGADVILPDMLVATIQACPVFGGTLISVDDAPALKVPGVEKVVALDNAVAVVASGYWPAMKGLKALQPVWDVGTRGSYGLADVNADLEAALDAPDAPELLAKGDVPAHLRSSAAKLTFEMTAPYLAHACMEPMNATVHVQEGRVDAWVPCQGNTMVVEGIAAALKIDPLTVRVTRTYLGGGFGRRSDAEYAAQAALISKAVNRPVKLIWSREEDIRHDFYRPISKVRMTAVVDDNGVLQAWDILNAAPSISKRRFPQQIKDGKDPSSLAGFGDQPYNLAHMRVRSRIVDTGIPVGFWRSVNHGQNIFYRESMLNELAARVGLDGLAYRRLLLTGNERYLAMLDDVEALSEFQTPLAPGPKGTKRGRGIAIGNSHGALCAQVADVTVQADSSFTIDRFSCVIDVGVIVNPSIVEAQMESSVIDGLGMTLFGQMTPQNGGMAEGNFNDVRFLRLAEAPELRIRVKDWPGANPGGVGEPAVPPTAPAVTDALAQATGLRLRALPVVRQGFSV